MFNKTYLSLRCCKPILVFLAITLCHTLVTDVQSSEVLPAPSLPNKKSSIVSAWGSSSVHTYRHRRYRGSNNEKYEYFNNKKKKNSRCRKKNRSCNPNKSQCCRGLRCRKKTNGKKKFLCLKKKNKQDEPEEPEEPESGCHEFETQDECECRLFWEDRSAVANAAAFLAGIVTCPGTPDLDAADNTFIVPVPICKYSCPGDDQPLQRTLFGAYRYSPTTNVLTAPGDQDCFTSNLKEFLPRYINEGAESPPDCEGEKGKYSAFQNLVISDQSPGNAFSSCNFNQASTTSRLEIPIPATGAGTVFDGTCA